MPDPPATGRENIPPVQVVYVRLHFVVFGYTHELISDMAILDCLIFFRLKLSSSQGDSIIGEAQYGSFYAMANRRP
jgi:hypothetical protein